MSDAGLLSCGGNTNCLLGSFLGLFQVVSIRFLLRVDEIFDPFR